MYAPAHLPDRRRGAGTAAGRAGRRAQKQAVPRASHGEDSDSHCRSDAKKLSHGQRRCSSGVTDCKLHISVATHRHALRSPSHSPTGSPSESAGEGRTSIVHRKANGHSIARFRGRVRHTASSQHGCGGKQAERQRAGFTFAACGAHPKSSDVGRHGSRFEMESSGIPSNTAATTPIACPRDLCSTNLRRCARHGVGRGMQGAPTAARQASCGN
jgi:hypothetical protein